MVFGSAVGIIAGRTVFEFRTDLDLFDQRESVPPSPLMPNFSTLNVCA
jgi:hypothetical protein